MQALIQRLQETLVSAAATSSKAPAVIHATIPDSSERKRLHIECQAHKDYIFRSAYEPDGYEVKCDGCDHWLSTEGGENACCGSDHDGSCNSIERRITCSYCGDFVYWSSDEMRDEIKEGKLRAVQWKPTGEVIFLKKGLTVPLHPIVNGIRDPLQRRMQRLMQRLLRHKTKSLWPVSWRVRLK